MTMTELARQLKVSQATVSMVLNNNDAKRVNPDLAERIRAAAQAVGFRPNQAASMLRRRQSKTVGVLFPSPAHPYFGELVGEIYTAIRKIGFDPVFSFWENEKQQRMATEKMLEWNPVMLITMEPAMLPDPVDVPVVSFHKEDPRFDYVGFDHNAAADLQLSHASELGHRHGAWIGVNEELRTNALLGKTSEYGLRIDINEWCSHYQREGQSALDKDIRHLCRECRNNRGKKVPTALFIHDDLLALEVISRIFENGLKVPQDFSVIGHDALRVGTFMRPSLTSISYSTGHSVGALLVQTVMKRLQDPEAPRMKLLLRPFLQKGTSSDVARAEGVAS